MYNHQEYIEKHKRRSGGWRLPTIAELFSLVDYRKHGPASKVKMSSNAYWSSTTHAISITNAWFLNFNNGNIAYAFKTNIMYIRCVRDTPSGLEWSEDASTPMYWYDAMKYAEEL